ncbi:MAG: hypothetical protein AAF490_09250 [Chloroflexota bacterium]
MADIDKSIFYEGIKSSGSSLPSGDLVKPGGLYMMNDDGGLIFQLSMPEGNQSESPTGHYDSSSNILTIRKAHVLSANETQTKTNASAISYKKYPNVTSDVVRVSNRAERQFRVKIFPNLKLNPLSDDALENAYCVHANNGEDIFYLYNVHDIGNQLPVFHIKEINPSPNNDFLHSTLGGVLFVQFLDNSTGEKKVCLGYLEENSIFIKNKDHAFTQEDE